MPGENDKHDTKFSLLLPLLKGKAVKMVSRLVESLPANAYTAAKELLLLHFCLSSEEMIAELHGLSSLGDYRRGLFGVHAIPTTRRGGVQALQTLLRTCTSATRPLDRRGQTDVGSNGSRS